MPTLSTSQERSFFRVFLQGWSNLYDETVRNIQQYAREQISLGRSREEIIAELEADGGTVLRKFRGSVESRIELGTNTIFQISGNAPLEGVGEKFKWKLDPSAEHCDSCLYQASRPAGDFRDFPYPTTQPTHGETNCGTYCKCTLEVADAS